MFSLKRVLTSSISCIFWFSIVFFCISSSNTNSVVSAATDDIQIEIQHRLSNSQIPTSRGVFIIQKLDTTDRSTSSSSSSSATASSSGNVGATPISGGNSLATAASSTQQILASINAKPVQTQSQQIVDIKQNGIYDNEKDLEVFKQLLKSNGLYKIQLRTVFQNQTSKFIMASIPACELQRSGFKEEILLHLDNRNQPIGVSYSSPIIALPRPCDPNKVRLPLQFHTRIKLMDPVMAQSVPLQATGPQPATLAKVHPSILNTPSSGLGGGDNDSGRSGNSNNGDGQSTSAGVPNQPSSPPAPESFLQKYWFVVVGLLVYLYMSPGPATKDSKADKENGNNNRVDENAEEDSAASNGQQQSASQQPAGIKKAGLRPI